MAELMANGKKVIKIAKNGVEFQQVQDISESDYSKLSADQK